MIRKNRHPDHRINHALICGVFQPCTRFLHTPAECRSIVCMGASWCSFYICGGKFDFYSWKYAFFYFLLVLLILIRLIRL